MPSGQEVHPRKEFGINQYIVILPGVASVLYFKIYGGLNEAELNRVAGNMVNKDK